MNKLHIQIPRLIEGLPNRLLGDFVKHHPFGRNFWGQKLEQMPTDALPFAIFVRRQQQLISTLERILQLPDNFLFVLGDHVQRFKIRLGVHTQIRPFLPLGCRRNFTGVIGQITHMPHGGLNLESLREKAANGARLGRAFNDDKGVRH